MTIYALVADQVKLRNVFNTADDQRDSMLLFPFDITMQKNLADRFGRGQLVSYAIDDSGCFKIVNDCDPQHLGASMFFVKDVVRKTFNMLTDHEIQCVDSINPCFAEKYQSGNICIGDDTLVTLVRFNLQQVLHFTPTPHTQFAHRLIH